MPLIDALHEHSDTQRFAPRQPRVCVCACVHTHTHAHFFLSLCPFLSRARAHTLSHIPPYAWHTQEGRVIGIWGLVRVVAAGADSTRQILARLRCECMCAHVCVYVRENLRFQYDMYCLSPNLACQRRKQERSVHVWPPSAPKIDFNSKSHIHAEYPAPRKILYV